MSTITIKAFAQQIGIEPERLVKQLNDAGVADKTVEDSLRDEEKRKLLEFLRGGVAESAAPKESGSRGKITLKKKTNSEIQQTSKTGIARTVQVQTKKRRTFVKREVLEQEEAELATQEKADVEAQAAAQTQAAEKVVEAKVVEPEIEAPVVEAPAEEVPVV